MRRLITAMATLALVAALAASPVMAKTHSFKLHRDAKINSTQLNPGTYKLELNGNGEGLIYRNNKLVTKAAVEVKPRTNGISRGVEFDSDRNVVEIRTKNQIVVFVR